MTSIKNAYRLGSARALHKLALGPPTQVDQFVADVEQGKDVPPPAALPPMPGMGGPEIPPALDGTTPLSTSPPTPPSMGSTIGTQPSADSAMGGNQTPPSPMFRS